MMDAQPPKVPTPKKEKSKPEQRASIPTGKPTPPKRGRFFRKRKKKCWNGCGPAGLPPAPVGASSHLRLQSCSNLRLGHAVRKEVPVPLLPFAALLACADAVPVKLSRVHLHPLFPKSGHPFLCLVALVSE